MLLFNDLLRPIPDPPVRLPASYEDTGCGLLFFACVLSRLHGSDENLLTQRCLFIVSCDSSAGILLLQRSSWIAMALSAAFRIVLLIISNMLVHSPAVLVLLSQLSSFLMILVLGIQTTQWGKIGLFPMNKQGQARVGFSSKCAAGLFFVGTILFPTLILTSDDFLQKKTFSYRLTT